MHLDMKIWTEKFIFENLRQRLLDNIFFFLLKLLALFIGVLPITRIKSNSRNGHTAVVVLDVFAVVVVSSFPGSPR